MCWLERLAIGAVSLIVAVAPASAVMAADESHFGKPVTQADIAAWDISIGPDGAGLPPGSGTVAQGETVYAAKCQACHAEKGAGGPNDRLVGGAGTIAPNKAPVKTVGSYWPYATTLFDYIRRSMPWTTPRSLTDEQVYALTAYILAQNKLIDAQQVIDAQSLPKVEMPNRNGFIPRFPERMPPK
jgi:hypothetical protein